MFLDNFLTVLTQVSILFLLIFIGAVANKTKLLSVEANKKISDVVVTIVAPSVIISSFLSSAKGLAKRDTRATKKYRDFRAYRRRFACGYDRFGYSYFQTER